MENGKGLKLRGKVHRVDSDGNLSDKYCKKCDSWKDIKDWGKNKSSVDGLQHYCKKCQNEMSTIAHKKKREREKVENVKENNKKSSNVVSQLMMTKDKGKKPSSRWDTSDKVVSDKMINLIEPVFKYISNLTVMSDGTVLMKKSVMDIVSFFDLEPRRGIDLVYTYIRRDEDKYRYARKIGTVMEMASMYEQSLIVKKDKDEDESAFLAERFYAVEQEVKDLKRLINELINELK